MVVLDASLIVNAVTMLDHRGEAARRVMAEDTAWVAPVHWRVEAFSAVRGLVIGGALTPAQGGASLGRTARLAIDDVALGPLIGSMWRLRDSLTGYDAAYVVLAAVREVTLLTADARLARAAVPHCRVQLVT